MSTSTPRFVLPGKWAHIPLTSEAATLSSIRKMAEQLTNRMDQFATLRAEMRARFVQAAEVARSGGATDLFLGLELLPGIPLPAWIVVYPADYNTTDFDSIGFGDFSKALEIAAGPGPVGGTREVGDVESPTPIHAVRHAWRRTTEVVEGNVDETFEFVEADYWIAASEPNRLALVTFSTALADYEEEMLELFDAVISTVRWPAPSPAPA